MAATTARPQPVHTAGAPMANGFDSENNPSPRNLKAEAYGDAYKQRVEVEVNAWLTSEIRKAEARAGTSESKVEQKRMKEEAKAAEHNKREDAKAEQHIRAAEVKAQKIIANAKEEAIRMRAHAKEECERGIANSHTEAERAKAEQQEIKNREIAELKDRAEQMKTTGELPVYEKEKKGIGAKMKHVLTFRH